MLLRRSTSILSGAPTAVSGPIPSGTCRSCFAGPASGRIIVATKLCAVKREFDDTITDESCDAMTPPPSDLPRPTPDAATTGLPLNLTQVPFSAAGSYLALSHPRPSDEIEDGLWVRSIRGAAGRREIARLDLGDAQQNPQTVFVDEQLHMSTADAAAEVRFDGPDAMVIRVTRGALSLSIPSFSQYDTVAEMTAGCSWRLLRLSSQSILTLEVSGPILTNRHDWDGVTSQLFELAVGAGAELRFTDLTDGAAAATDAAQLAPNFEEFLEAMPAAPDGLSETRRLAGYIMWSSIVNPSGAFTRPSMLMSKNWMCGVWSWDHCFNTLALAGLPQLAQHQFLTIFDQQRPSGQLPDVINDAFASWVFVKPPIHGWTVLQMIENGSADDDFLRQIYEPLSRWTNWWLTERVLPGRRLPHYLHGNDSGWDNSTVFQADMPLESPDLAALLVIQLEALSVIAARLGHAHESADWQAQSDETLTFLVEDLWDGAAFFAAAGTNAQRVTSPTLLLFLPLILGTRLPTHIRDTLIERFTSSGLLTEYGAATEPVTSTDYDEDGYWRGPIWAPPTAMLVDGLVSSGSTELAEEFATKFCGMAAASGMAENYNAVTGEGLRDRAYSWTASVFLLLSDRLASTAKDKP